MYKNARKLVYCALVVTTDAVLHEDRRARTLVIGTLLSIY